MFCSLLNILTTLVFLLLSACISLFTTWFTGGRMISNNNLRDSYCSQLTSSCFPSDQLIVNTSMLLFTIDKYIPRVQSETGKYQTSHSFAVDSMLIQSNFQTIQFNPGVYQIHKIDHSNQQIIGSPGVFSFSGKYDENLTFIFEKAIETLTVHSAINFLKPRFLIQEYSENPDPELLVIQLLNPEVSSCYRIVFQKTSGIEKNVAILGIISICSLVALIITIIIYYKKNVDDNYGI